MTFRIATRAETFYKVAALFEGLNAISFDGIGGAGIKVVDPRTDEIVGSIVYHPFRDGVLVQYLGYGWILHPKKDAEEINRLKEQYPNLSTDLFLWARTNIPEPRYAGFAHEELGKAMRAEPIGESFYITPEQAQELGEDRLEIPIERIRRSNLHS